MVVKYDHEFVSVCFHSSKVLAFIKLLFCRVLSSFTSIGCCCQPGTRSFCLVWLDCAAVARSRASSAALPVCTCSATWCWVLGSCWLAADTVSTEAPAAHIAVCKIAVALAVAVVGTAVAPGAGVDTAAAGADTVVAVAAVAADTVVCTVAVVAGPLAGTRAASCRIAGCCSCVAPCRRRTHVASCWWSCCRL